MHVASQSADAIWSRITKLICLRKKRGEGLRYFFRFKIFCLAVTHYKLLIECGKLYLRAWWIQPQRASSTYEIKKKKTSLFLWTNKCGNNNKVGGMVCGWSDWSTGPQTNQIQCGLKTAPKKNSGESFFLVGFVFFSGWLNTINRHKKRPNFSVLFSSFFFLFLSFQADQKQHFSFLKKTKHGRWRCY